MTPQPDAGRGGTLLAVGFYLGVALWSMRAVLPTVAETFPFPTMFEGMPGSAIIHSDQKFVAGNIVENARRLLTRPLALFDSGQCYPAERSLTLGEHMLAEGLLAVVPYLATGDPVVTYNVVLVLRIWIAGLAMYALVRYWTGSAGAALVAGLLFAVHPQRLADPAHPFVHGNLWTPLALLFAHRLFAERRWRDAAGLALFLALQALESIYPVVGLVLLGGAYGLYVALRHVRQLPALVPKLVLCFAVAAAVAGGVLRPYLRTRGTWGVLSRPGTLLHRVQDFGPGRFDFPGFLVLGLAAVALLDRLRGARPRFGDDPRLVILAGGLLVLWVSVWALPVPLLGVYLPLYRVLATVLPGLDAVRAGGAISIGIHLAAAFLAGYGVLALTERWRPLVRHGLVMLLAGAALAEVFDPWLCRQTYGSSVELKPYEVRPPDEVLARYRALPAGAVLDLPFHSGTFAGMVAMADYVYLRAFHRRPVAACYNSFKIPTQDDIEALAARLPDPGAADALHALGFRSVVLHGENYPPGLLALELVRLRREAASGRLREVATAAKRTFYLLRSPVRVEPSFTALAAAGAPPETVDAVPPEHALEFVFRSRDETTYRHPPPLEPTPLVVRWYGGAGDLLAEHRVAALLPLALAGGEQLARTVRVPVPSSPGDYEVTLAPAATPDLVVARRRVRVGPVP